MASRSSDLLDVLAAWPDTAGASPPARRAATAWASDPVLAGFATPGGAARAVAGPDGSVVLAALFGRRGDEWAATAAMAGLAGRLVPVARRWARAGMPPADLDSLCADLVADCWEVLCRPGQRDPDRVARTAWHRTAGRRRTELARAARHADLADTVPAPAERTCVEQLLGVLVDALAAGRVGRAGAAALAAQAAGWPTGETAAAVGVDPATLRARRARAVRALAGPVAA